MIRLLVSLVAFSAALAALPEHPAQAANTKSYVSNTGSDANPCTFALPCAGFQRAHDQTNPGGEVGVLTPGDYGGVVVLKGISIINDGSGEAAIGGGAQIETAAGAGGVVSVRGLVLDGMIHGATGIHHVSGSALHVQNCVIRNFEGVSTAAGIVSEAPGTQLFVSDTNIFNNGSGVGSGGIVVFAAGGGAGVKVVLDRVHLDNNVEGLLISGVLVNAPVAARVIVRDSVISGNVANGIHAFTPAGRGPAFAFVERTTIVNNRQNGILADGPGATVLLDDSAVVRNNVGIGTVNSGQLISYGNNRVNNNIGPDGAPTSFLALN